MNVGGPTDSSSVAAVSGHGVDDRPHGFVAASVRCGHLPVAAGPQLVHGLNRRDGLQPCFHFAGRPLRGQKRQPLGTARGGGPRPEGLRREPHTARIPNVLIDVLGFEVDLVARF